MSSHIRANLWLLVLSVVICSILYPAALLGIGQTIFREKANGSLILDKDGKVVGSKLIAQPFGSDEYFQPRPSAASYNGAASGASNWGASNYLLRDRVARQLGPITYYAPGCESFDEEGGPLPTEPRRGEPTPVALKAGDPVGPSVEKWLRNYHKKHPDGPGLAARWAGLHKGLAESWVKAAGDALKEQWQKQDGTESFALQWQKDFPKTYADWQ